VTALASIDGISEITDVRTGAAGHDDSVLRRAHRTNRTSRSNGRTGRTQRRSVEDSAGPTHGNAGEAHLGTGSGTQLQNGGGPHRRRQQAEGSPPRTAAEVTAGSTAGRSAAGSNTRGAERRRYQRSRGPLDRASNSNHHTRHRSRAIGRGCRRIHHTGPPARQTPPDSGPAPQLRTRTVRTGRSPPARALPPPPAIAHRGPPSRAERRRTQSGEEPTNGGPRIVRSPRPSVTKGGTPCFTH